MYTPQHIAQALTNVKKVTTARGADIIRSNEIKRGDRELLVHTRWLQEIMKGWYMLTRPDLNDGDSTAWYTNFWDFLRIYLNERFGDHHCLSAESSLEIYTQSPIIPRQVIVLTPSGGTNNYQLPHDTSLLIYAERHSFPQEKTVIQNLQLLPLEIALCKSPPTYFQKNPNNAEIALQLVKNPSQLSKTLIELHSKAAANRIVGAYQFIKNFNYADTINHDLETVGIIVKPTNPFSITEPTISQSRVTSPYAARIQALWSTLRTQVLTLESSAPKIKVDKAAYCAQLNELYKHDAFNSLSIEGYQVTLALIEKVQDNNWNPDTNTHDRNLVNALAAKGYREAFQAVKKTIQLMITEKKPAELLENNLSDWYRCLFSPSVSAGLINPHELVGYRNHRVHIRNSRHIPPPKDALIDCMEAFFDCMKQEESALVRAIIGHYLFVFIHPYMDGNGRMARFIMNAMLTSGGYPWTIIEVTNRDQYMDCLSITDENQDISAFARFIIESMERSISSTSSTK